MFSFNCKLRLNKYITKEMFLTQTIRHKHNVVNGGFRRVLSEYRTSIFNICLINNLAKKNRKECICRLKQPKNNTLNRSHSQGNGRATIFSLLQKFFNTLFYALFNKPENILYIQLISPYPAFKYIVHVHSNRRNGKNFKKPFFFNLKDFSFSLSLIHLQVRKIGSPFLFGCPIRLINQLISTPKIK